MAEFVLYTIAGVSCLLCGSSSRFHGFGLQFVIVVFPDHTH